MTKWQIQADNANEYKGKVGIPAIKALIVIVREAGLGGLREAARFVHGHEPLMAVTRSYVRKVIDICDAHGINVTITEIRRINAAEFDTLAREE